MTYAQSVRLGRMLRRRAADILVLLLSVMFCTFIWQIFTRYILNNPASWTEEVIVSTWLWTVLWGAAFVLTEAEEIRFDIVYSNISESVRRIFTVLTGIAAVAMYAISFPATFSYVSFMRVEHSAMLRIPLDILYSVYVFFALASIVRYSALIYFAVKGEPPPAVGPAKIEDKVEA